METELPIESPKSPDSQRVEACAAPFCWAGASSCERNAVIGKLIGGEVIRRPYIAREGKYLWPCMITAAEAAERNKWLLEQQSTPESWARFRSDFDERITAEDRGKITIEIEEHYLRYSDTPAGGWMVIEALQKLGCSFEIKTLRSEWQVVAIDSEGDIYPAICETMEEAACKAALRFFEPNT
jgi:hypothetical protein